MKCGARKRGTEAACAAPAMPNGRCRIHGGNAGRPPIHGRYSLVHRAALAEKAARFLEDPAPGDLGAELALTRAFLQDYLERFGDHGAIRAEDIQFMVSLIGAIGSLVERISRMLNATALTQAEVQFLTARVADILVEYIDDPDRRAAALDELGGALGVAPGAAGPGRRALARA